MTSVPIYIFTALPCEAKPLIAHFKLKKVTTISHFAIYTRDSMTLTVSGLGKSAMAAAVAYTLASFPTEALAVLVNVGIAGHKTQARGTLFAAEKIIDEETQSRYYPQLMAGLSCPTQTIRTVAKAQLEYSTEALYEMEASAFYETAVRFTSSELIQCLKVISDNEQQSVEQITPAQVSEWIAAQIPSISECLQQLQALAAQVETVVLEDYQTIMQHWRFSHNQQLQLKRLLSQWQILSSEQALDLSQQQGLTAKELLYYVQQRITALPFGGFHLDKNSTDTD